MLPQQTRINMIHLPATTPMSFEGIRLAGMSVRRSSGAFCQRHRLNLYRASTGKYILEEMVQTGEYSHPRARLICFDRLEDLFPFFMTDHPIPAELAKELLDRARERDRHVQPTGFTAWNNTPSLRLQ